jgi:hypothetical protein
MQDDVLARAYIFRCDEYGWKPTIQGYEAYCHQVLSGKRENPYDMVMQERLPKQKTGMPSRLSTVSETVGVQSQGKRTSGTGKRKKPSGGIHNASDNETETT